MITGTFVFLIITTLCDAEIMIKIKISSNRNYVTLNYSGHDNKLVSDKEIKLFNITNDNLNRGLRIELGKIPDSVFLKDPTTFDNLFEKYKWPEVERQLFINKARIIEVVNEKVTLKTHEYTNNTTDTIRINKILRENVECTSFSSWSDYGYPNDELFYNVTLNFEAKRFGYTMKWRDSGVHSATIPLLAAVKGKLDVESGKTIISKLIANKTILLIEFDYVAKLIGSVIAHFAHLYGKYHFWAPSLANIMRDAELKNELVTRELMEIRCYTDPKLEMFDKATGKEIQLHKPIKLIHRGKKIILRRL